MVADEIEMVMETAGELFHAAREHTGGDLAAQSAAGWELLAKQGMTHVSVPHPGGAGESLRYVGALLTAAGRAAFSVPLIDTHVGATLLAAADFPGADLAATTDAAYAVGLDGRLLCPAGPQPSTLTVVHPELAGTVVTALVDVDVARIAAWRWNDLELDVRRNIAGEPIGLLDLETLPLPSWSGEVPLQVARRAARVDSLGRSLMIAGAAERALEQTLRYVGERRQFGRALAGFQSVQHAIAQMAALVTAASVSADAALAALEAGVDDVASRSESESDLVAVLSCRIQCSRTAAFVSRMAHQLHGAIGFTEEHPLRLATTRLTAWRAHGPSHAQVVGELGRRAFAAAELWPFLTGTDLQRSGQS